MTDKIQEGLVVNKDNLQLLVSNIQKARPTEEITKEQDNISDNSIECKLLKLKEKLKNEVKEERYEDAAKTRDEIKKLSKE